MTKGSSNILIRIALTCFSMVFLLLPFALSTTAHADGGFPIIGVLHNGRAPEALAVDTQTHMLYIAYEAPGLIVGFDPISGTVRWHTPLNNVATDVQVDNNSHRVYASAVSYQDGRSNLYVLDGSSGKVLATMYSGSGDNSIALDSPHHIVYASSEDRDTIYKYTFQSGWQSGPIQIQTSQFTVGPRPDALGVNSRLGRLYVADSATNTVTVINENNGHTLATILVAAMPLPPLRVDEANSRVYVVCSAGQELDVIDGNTNKVIARPPVAPYPEGVAFNTATGQIYVADEGSEEGSRKPDSGTTVTVIDGQTFDVLGNLQIGRGPDGVESDPSLHRVYIAAEDSNTVTEITDSTDLPLTSHNLARQIIAADQTISFLQQAAIVTLIAMFLTIVGAALGALLQHWRAREIPQNPPTVASSRLERHSPPR